MQSINPHAVHGEPGTGFEKRGKRGPKNMRALLTRTLQTLLGTLLMCGLSASARAQGFSTQQFCDGQQGAVDASELYTESLFYQNTTIEKLAMGKVHMTRAEVNGTVTLVKRENDGDIHIRVSDGKRFIVAECMPDLPCLRPKVGNKVSVEGITRFDGEHKWWELHPVTHLEIINDNKWLR